MLNKGLIKKSKLELKNAEKELRKIKKSIVYIEDKDLKALTLEKIREATLDIRRIKSSIRKAELQNLKESISVRVALPVVFSCGIVHLGLKYATDYVENMESKIRTYAYGEVKEEVIRSRNKITIKRQLHIKAKIDNLKEHISSIGFSLEDIDILRETGSIKS